MAMLVAAGSASAYEISQTYAADSRPLDLVIGKVNRGQALDVVTANRDGRSISVLLGNGDGTFDAADNYDLQLPDDRLFQGSGVAIGRFNDDRLPDLFVTGNETSSDQSDAVLVFIGIDGGFRTVPRAFNVATEEANDIALADFNRDRRLDFVVGDSVGNSVYARFGRRGGFSKPKRIRFAFPDSSDGTEPQWLEVGDFNRDGFPDAAAAVGRLGAFGVLYTKTKVMKPRRKPNGGMTRRRVKGLKKFRTKRYPSLGLPYGLAAGDLNGDGRLDLASPDDYSPSSETISVIYGKGRKRTAGFRAARSVDVGGNPLGGIAIGNYGGGAGRDIGVFNNSSETIAILFNDPGEPSGFSDPSEISFYSFVLALKSADLNGDGVEDFVAGQFNDGNIAVGLSD